MSGLFGLLSMGARSLGAAQYGLDVAGQNVANVNTPGYSRRVADFGAVPPINTQLGAGNGVEVLGVRAQRDRLFDLRLYREIPYEQREAAIADSLSVIETALGAPGESLDLRLTKFFDAWSTLAEAPTSATARAQVVAEGQALATGFHDISLRLDEATRDVDANVRATVDEINTLAAQIASLNAKITSSGVAGTLTLRDEQSEAIKKLAALVDIQTIESPDGSVEVSYGSGQPLVNGEHTFPIGITSAPVTGLAQIISGGVDVTSQIKGGRLDGFLHTRDTLLPDYRAQLDTIAYTVVQQVNTLHDAGFTLTGVDAPPFFDALGSATNAARLISVNAAVTANHGLVAAGGIAGTPGDNQTARALANLRDAKVLGGNTATLGDGWSQLVYDVGKDGNAAALERDSRAEVVRQIENLRDSVSGVSLDEEAAAMMRFQRAYEANARFFNTVNAALEVLMNLGA